MIWDNKPVAHIPMNKGATVMLKVVAMSEPIAMAIQPDKKLMAEFASPAMCPSGCKAIAFILPIVSPKQKNMIEIRDKNPKKAERHEEAYYVSQPTGQDHAQQGGAAHHFRAIAFYETGVGKTGNTNKSCANAKVDCKHIARFKDIAVNLLG